MSHLRATLAFAKKLAEDGLIKSPSKRWKRSGLEHK